MLYEFKLYKSKNSRRTVILRTLRSFKILTSGNHIKQTLNTIIRVFPDILI